MDLVKQKLIDLNAVISQALGWKAFKVPDAVVVESPTGVQTITRQMGISPDNALKYSQINPWYLGVQIEPDLLKQIDGASLVWNPVKEAWEVIWVEQDPRGGFAERCESDPAPARAVIRAFCRTHNIEVGDWLNS